MFFVPRNTNNITQKLKFSHPRLEILVARSGSGSTVLQQSV